MNAKVLVVAQRKGGGGKTNLSRNLGVHAELCGDGPVAFIDADDMEGLTKWHRARAAETPILVQVEAQPIKEIIRSLSRSGIKLIVIDTAPSENETVREAIKNADLVVIPTRPTPADMRAVGDTVTLVAKLKKPMVFILSSVRARARLTVEAAMGLSQHGRIAPIAITELDDYNYSDAVGMAAEEYAPKGKAAGEVAELWKYLRTYVLQ